MRATKSEQKPPPNIMSVAAYAKLRGVTQRTIRYQIDKGVIAVVPGRVDTIDANQADEAWWIQRSARAIVNSEAGQRNAQAKLADAGVRVRLARHRFETTRERFIDRNDTLAQIAEETELFLTELQEIPMQQQNHKMLMDELGIDQPTARTILARFVTLIVSEVGDLQSAGMGLVNFV